MLPTYVHVVGVGDTTQRIVQVARREQQESSYSICCTGLPRYCWLWMAFTRLSSSRSAAILTSSCLAMCARYSTIFDRRPRLLSSTSSAGCTNSMPACRSASSVGPKASSACAILSLSISISSSTWARSLYSSFFVSENFFAFGSKVSMANSSWMCVVRIWRSMSSRRFSFLYTSWPSVLYRRRNASRYSWCTLRRRSASSWLVLS
mmetsp:Transcript_18456/g.57255  ORF Transcript_18456/g.57255 Transcript_18456/m.57255 type:complete len:206 (-) Transcript_18456:1256-1873(-)